MIKRRLIRSAPLTTQYTRNHGGRRQTRSNVAQPLKPL